jgi:hypothetical protein
VRGGSADGLGSVEELGGSGTDGGVLDVLGGDAVKDELGGKGGPVGMSSPSGAESVLPLVESRATDGGVGHYCAGSEIQ